MRTFLGLLTLAIVLVSGCALTRVGSEAPPTERNDGPAYRLTVPGETGADLQVDVFDDTQSVRDARAASKPELVAATEAMPAEGIVALPVAGDRRGVLVAWIGLTCDEHAVITVSPGIRQIVISPQRREPCDLLPNGRGVVLSFGAAVDPALIDVQLAQTDPPVAAAPSPSGGPTPVAPEATPYEPPSPACPAPDQAVGAPFVMASIGEGPGIEATVSSFVVTTCSTTNVSDAVVEPSVPLRAGPADRLRFTLPEAWRFLHWEGFDRPAVGEGANVWPPVDLADRPASLEIPVPARAGDSVVGLDVTVITEDERAVARLSIAVLVHVE